MGPSSVVLVGKPAYYWSYMAPVAREFRRRFKTPITAVALGGDFGDSAEFIQPGKLSLLRRPRVAIAFDVWSMIAARLYAHTVVYVHHSLVGKGLVFKCNKPFRPFLFADKLCLPLQDRASDVPPRTRRKVHITGHPPFDWLLAEPPLPRWIELLQAWGDGGRRLRVGVLCTHGEFGSAHLLEDIARLRSDNCDFGVKLHGYLKNQPLPLGMRSLGDCPTALLVDACDLVITDHSTAAVEAHVLGVPCICFWSEALGQLQKRYPDLTELHYLKHVPCYRTIPELAALLASTLPIQSRLPTAMRHGPDGPSAASRLLDLCMKELS
ncbi:MAG: hypothetical protein JWQ01_4564 [Massilia sp.]|nr:hypothetical protein [Massilia sp.]